MQSSCIVLLTSFVVYYNCIPKNVKDNNGLLKIYKYHTRTLKTTNIVYLLTNFVSISCLTSFKSMSFAMCTCYALVYS